MDWKQFIASIVGSLAWPCAFLVLVLILRKQLPSLAERLEELTLPFGAKATFEKQLETARKEAEKLPDVPVDLESERLVPEGEERRFLRLAATSPENAVLEAYDGIEAVLIKIATELGLQPGTATQDILNELVRRDLIDVETLQLANALTQARNVAAHIRPGRLTSGEALDFGEHTDKLSGRLHYALGRLVGRKQAQP